MYLDGSDERERDSARHLSGIKAARSVIVHSVAEVSLVFHLLDAALDDHGYPRIDRFAVNLAVWQAVANALGPVRRRHGRPAVHLSFVVGPDEVVVEVKGPDADEACESCPMEFRAANAGREWALLRVCTTWMTFDAESNRVVFGRRRSQSGRSATSRSMPPPLFGTT